LSTSLDDYSRYILAWTLRTSMGATDVMETLDLARAAAGVDRVPVVYRPLQRRKRENLHTPHHAAIRSNVSLRNGAELSNLA
jgi:transposase InsO family protein